MTASGHQERSLARQLADRTPYSWRDDDRVPAFPDDRTLIVFDGVCVLCSGFARFVARQDRDGQFLFTAAQSPLGQALYRHLGLDPVNFESNLLVLDGCVLGKMEAFSAIVMRLGWPWRLLAVAGWLPRPVGDWLYDRIARNRYRLLGRRDRCVVPDAAWRERVIE